MADTVEVVAPSRALMVVSIDQHPRVSSGWFGMWWLDRFRSRALRLPLIQLLLFHAGGRSALAAGRATFADAGAAQHGHPHP